MSSYINIFVEGGSSLQELVAMLKGMLDITQSSYDPERGMPYHLYEEHTEVLVGENTFFNVDDLNFEDFHYEIDLRGIHFKDSGERSQWGYQRAQSLFQRLKEMGTYRLMLTLDHQIKDEEFVPPHYQHPPSGYAIKAQQLPEDIVVYVSGDIPMHAFLQELEHILHTSAQERMGINRWYLFQDERAHYHVMQTAKAGRYRIGVKGRVYIPGERRYWQFETARHLYAQLKATGRYALQLKDSDEHILEEYVPSQQV